MAGEVLIVNPRGHRRRKRRRTRRTRSSRPHRRRRRAVAANPRPRRRRRARAHRGRRYGRRRAHRNPRGLSGSFMGVNFGQALMGGAGFVGTNLLAGQLGRFIPAPADPNMANLTRIGLKAAATIGGAMLLRRTPLRGFANAWAVGGGISTAVDLLSTFVLPMIPGLSAYESGVLTGTIADYETGVLTGDEVQMMGAGSGPYESGAYA